MRKNLNIKNILFIGDLNKYGRSIYRCETLKNLNYVVDSISHTCLAKDLNQIYKHSLAYRISWKLKFPIDESRINKKIITMISSNSYDLVWIEKGNDIWPSTLKKIKKLLPKVILLSISEDDMYASHSYSFWYKFGLKYYDFVFTTKSYNLEELAVNFGAKKVFLFYDSYIQSLHKKIHLSQKQKEIYSSDVSAIGAYEQDRAEYLFYLAKNGIKVSVWGNGWDNFDKTHKNLDIKHKYLFNEDYSLVINSSKININFLRKVNRDTITSRSIEIPACQGFMITERTKSQQVFFKEGADAEYFSSKKELLEKVKFYLSKPVLRKKIAKNGYLKCLKNKLSMNEQLKKILEKISVES